MVERSQKLASGAISLVHYTTAENAMRIIQSNEFWLRNVRCMNDYSEVQHGVALILGAFHAEGSKRRDRLLQLCDSVAPSAAADAITAFDQWKSNLPAATFIGCLSEHDPADSLGRLSMWRAYANGAGVALVMNKTPFVAETDELKAYSLPVLYLSDIEFVSALDQCLDGIEANLAILSKIDGSALAHVIFWWLIFLSVSLKHPAFSEEREWRIIYLPSLERSEVILEGVEAISGIPQIVQKIPLRNAPDQGLHGADIPNLVAKIIVGPSQYPLVIKDALAAALDYPIIPLTHVLAVGHKIA